MNDHISYMVDRVISGQHTHLTNLSKSKAVEMVGQFIHDIRPPWETLLQKMQKNTVLGPSKRPRAPRFPKKMPIPEPSPKTKSIKLFK